MGQDVRRRRSLRQGQRVLPTSYERCIIIQGARSIATAEEGQKFILIADEAIQARLAALRAIRKAEGSEKRYLEHLRETQKLSVVTIEAVIRTGELLADLKKVPVMEPSLGKAPLRGSELSLPPNIDKKRSYMYQTLKRKETEVRELVEKALEGEGIPMWRAILAKLLKKKQEDPQAPPRDPAQRRGKTRDLLG